MFYIPHYIGFLRVSYTFSHIVVGNFWFYSYKLLVFYTGTIISLESVHLDFDFVMIFIIS
ncbi:hypothetical protein HanIR_Chr11g0560651 [Helianthus annuus]|nr:hypothetical protein HanIR_Chr11g0560651 [Helianthus annuus]